MSDAIVAQLQPRIEGPARGSVRLLLHITPAGELVEASVEEAPSPEIGILALEASSEAAPFPPLRAPCSARQHHSLRIFYDVPRDCAASAEVDAYLEGIRSALAATDVFRGLPRGGESIELRLSERGEIVSTRSSESMQAEAYQRIAAELLRLAPFPPPPEHLHECLVDEPFWLLVTVP